MKTKVDQNTCIGCGLCVQLAPSVFSMDKDKAIAIQTDIPQEQEEITRDCCDKCPVGSISIL